MALKMKICKLNDGLTPEPEPEGVNFVSSSGGFIFIGFMLVELLGRIIAEWVRSRVTQEESKFVGTIRV